MDYRENITFEKTVALKNFVRMKDYDLKQRLRSRNEKSTPDDIQITENIKLDDNVV